LVVWAFVVGSFVVGTFVVGAFVVSSFVVGAFVVGAFVVGSFVVGTVGAGLGVVEGMTGKTGNMGWQCCLEERRRQWMVRCLGGLFHFKTIADGELHDPET